MSNENPNVNAGERLRLLSASMERGETIVVLTRTEAEMLLRMLEQLSDYQSNKGSNDFVLPDSLDNREFVLAAQFEPNEPTEWHNEITVQHGEILTSDFVVAGYLRQIVKSKLAGEVVSE